MIMAATNCDVGVAEMKVSADPDATLITYALGSCLGICIHDPVARVGGMLHAMLPASSIDPEKARLRPAMFVDTGVPLLFKSCYQLGAAKERLLVKVAGGASVRGTGEEDPFQIGKRNIAMLRKLLWKNGVRVHAQEVGGQISRTVSMHVGSGTLVVRSPGTAQHTL